MLPLLTVVTNRTSWRVRLSIGPNPVADPVKARVAGSPSVPVAAATVSM
jgi:hypothetical protein